MMTSIYEPAKPDPAKGRPEEVLDLSIWYWIFACLLFEDIWIFACLLFEDIWIFACLLFEETISNVLNQSSQVADGARQQFDKFFKGNQSQMKREDYIISFSYHYRPMINSDMNL